MLQVLLLMARCTSLGLVHRMSSPMTCRSHQRQLYLLFVMVMAGM